MCPADDGDVRLWTRICGVLLRRRGKAHDIGEVSPDTQFVKAELYDASGRLLLTAESNVTQIGISHLPHGQYVLKLYDANGKTWSDKVVKE